MVGGRVFAVAAHSPAFDGGRFPGGNYATEALDLRILLARSTATGVTFSATSGAAIPHSQSTQLSSLGSGLFRLARNDD
jgi:hypothetical protein